MEPWGSVATLVWSPEEGRRLLWEGGGSLGGRGWVKVPEGDRVGGFLATQEQRQMPLQYVCMWICAQASGVCARVSACACCGHICTAERPFSAAVWMRCAYYWPMVQRFWACCLLFPLSITSERLFLPGLFWLSLKSLESSHPISGRSFHQIPLLTLLIQNLNKTKFCGEKVVIWVSTKPKLGRRKARLVVDFIKWCEALLVLPTSNCFSIVMLWQIITKRSSKTFFQEAWCIYPSLCSATHIGVLPSVITLMIVTWESSEAGAVSQH